MRLGQLSKIQQRKISIFCRPHENLCLRHPKGKEQSPYDIRRQIHGESSDTVSCSIKSTRVEAGAPE